MNLIHGCTIPLIQARTDLSNMMMASPWGERSKARLKSVWGDDTAVDGAGGMPEAWLCCIAGKSGSAPGAYGQGSPVMFGRIH